MYMCIYIYTYVHIDTRLHGPPEAGLRAKRLTKGIAGATLAGFQAMPHPNAQAGGEAWGCAGYPCELGLRRKRASHNCLSLGLSKASKACAASTQLLCKWPLIAWYPLFLSSFVNDSTTTSGNLSVSFLRFMDVRRSLIGFASGISGTTETLAGAAAGAAIAGSGWPADRNSRRKRRGVRTSTFFRSQ